MKGLLVQTVATDVSQTVYLDSLSVLLLNKVIKWKKLNSKQSTTTAGCCDMWWCLKTTESGDQCLLRDT